MKNYQWVLFDADETLFHFDSFKGLQHIFLEFGITFTKKDYAEYHAVNQSLFVKYQNGEITSQQVQHQRFEQWANKLQLTADYLNKTFLTTMAKISTPIDGATNLLTALKGKKKVGLITNGFTDLQHERLAHTGLRDHFDILVISEEVGIAKPHPGIFEHAFTKMGNPPRHQILMVGDTLESDILGGINAGIDTCWFNTKNKPAPEKIIPNYQIASLIELEKLLGIKY